jgi:hypothetical protein
MIYRLKLAKMKTPEHVRFKLLGTKVSHKAALEYINKHNFQELAMGGYVIVVGILIVAVM